LGGFDLPRDFRPFGNQTGKDERLSHGTYHWLGALVRAGCCKCVTCPGVCITSPRASALMPGLTVFRTAVYQGLGSSGYSIDAASARAAYWPGSFRWCFADAAPSHQTRLALASQSFRIARCVCRISPRIPAPGWSTDDRRSLEEESLADFDAYCRSVIFHEKSKRTECSADMAGFQRKWHWGTSTRN
jgi:hypothetical protein